LHSIALRSSSETKISSRSSLLVERRAFIVAKTARSRIQNAKRLPIDKELVMLDLVKGFAGGPSPHRSALRGYGIVYRRDEVNFCPGCGRSHWYIGRLMAECAYCGTAIPLQDSELQSAAGGNSRNRRIFVPTAFAA
jgi:hypothetical protein